jgi:FKBP-type peptidyl-prolyl cis-trans isomerase
MSTFRNIAPVLGAVALAGAVLFTGCGQQAGGAAEEITLTSDRDKYSYAVGVNIGTNFKDGYVDVDPDILGAAVRDVLENRSLRMTDQEMAQSMTTLQNVIQERYTAVMNDNRKASDGFLASNAKKEGVVSLPDSIQYEILTEGTGPKPVMGDTVTVHYQGTLLDGTVFDSSVQRGEPVEFTLDQVIPGWTEVLQLMPTGSKWRVHIPPQHAYGENGRPGIPPNALLTFEIELLGIK